MHRRKQSGACPPARSRQAGDESRAPRRRRARLNDRADDRVIAMTIALPRAGERAIRSIDLSRPVMVLLALFLCGLVLLPLGWLVWYSVTDNNGALTVGQFRAPGDRSDLRETISDGTRNRRQRGAGGGGGGAAARLAGGAHRPAAAPADPRPCHRLVRDPALSRRDRMGNPRRAEQRHPQPVRSRLVRARRIRASRSTSTPQTASSSRWPATAFRMSSC